MYPFYLNMTHRIEPFFFLNMTHRIEPFFSTWLKENDTIFWTMTQRVNWSFLQNVTHRIEPSSSFQRTSMTPRIEPFCFSQKIKELNPFLLDVTQMIFFFWKNNDSKDLIQRIEPLLHDSNTWFFFQILNQWIDFFFLKKWLKHLNLFQYDWPGTRTTTASRWSWLRWFKELNSLNMTQRIEPFYDSKRIERFFLFDVTQRNEPFPFRCVFKNWTWFQRKNPFEKKVDSKN